MAKEKQPQKPLSDTRAYFVIGDSPHDRFEDLARRLVSVPKREADEQAEAYERDKARKRRLS
jgi:hypothetical protein